MAHTAYDFFSNLKKHLTGKSETTLALFNISSTIITAGIAFFTIPIFTRLLNTDGYGTYSLYNTWAQIFAIFIGLKAEGSIAPASANLPEDEQEDYQFSILIMSLFSFFSIFFLVNVFSGILSNLLGLSKPLIDCMVIQSFAIFLINFFNMRYIFKKKAQMNFLISVAVAVFTTITSLIFIFVLPLEPYWGRILGYLIPYFIIAMLLLMTVVRHHHIADFSVKYIKFCLPLTLPLIFHGLSQLILAQSDQIIINIYYNHSYIGIYSIGVTVSGFLGSIYNALNNAYVPFLYDDFSGKNSEEKKQGHFNNYMHLFTTGTCAYIFIAPELLKLLASEQYWSAIGVVPILIIGQYFVFLYSFPVNFEFYKRKTATVAKGTAGAAVINTVLNFLLIPKFSFYGAALSTMISYIGLFFFHFFSARFLLGDYNFRFRSFMFGALAVIFSVILYYLLQEAMVIRLIIGLTLVCVMASRVILNRTIFLLEVEWLRIHLFVFFS